MKDIIRLASLACWLLSLAIFVVLQIWMITIGARPPFYMTLGFYLVRDIVFALISYVVFIASIMFSKKSVDSSKNISKSFKKISRYRKWVCFFVWLVSLITLMVGIHFAPQNYASMPYNPWDVLLRTSLFLGVLSFALMIIFILLDKKNTQLDIGKWA